jgi:uncharacterized protein
MSITPQQLVKGYQMEAHPEGGFFKELYRSDESIPFGALPERFDGSRNLSTAIFFLLEKGNFSAFHRIKSDECWHFYAGQPLLVHILYNDGELQTIKLGSNPLQKESFFAVVPATCWFASEPAPETEFSFVGCTVAPGFDFVDFELANATELVQEFPQHEDIIRRLCR